MKKVTLIISSIILTLLVVMLIYFNDYYKCDKKVYNYLKSNDSVLVSKIDNGYFFDGKGQDNAIIFYQGAKVEYTAYAPLMNKIASNGVDAFLIDMPFNFAFFNPYAANKITNNYKYDNYYICGHSLGGVVASIYASNHDKIKGIIFLASYPFKPIKRNIKVLSIYGSQDGVLNMDKYSNSKKSWNSSYEEFVIDGANHAGFGNYGKQSGDKKSKITNAEQQNITSQKIIEFILKQ